MNSQHKHNKWAAVIPETLVCLDRPLCHTGRKCVWNAACAACCCTESHFCRSTGSCHHSTKAWSWTGRDSKSLCRCRDQTKNGSLHPQWNLILLDQKSLLNVVIGEILLLHITLHKWGQKKLVGLYLVKYKWPKLTYLWSTWQAPAASGHCAALTLPHTLMK